MKASLDRRKVLLATRHETDDEALKACRANRAPAREYAPAHSEARPHS